MFQELKKEDLKGGIGLYFTDEVIPVLKEHGCLTQVFPYCEGMDEICERALSPEEWGVAIVGYRDRDTKEARTAIVEVGHDVLMSFTVFGEYSSNNVTEYEVYAVKSDLVRPFLNEKSARMLTRHSAIPP